MEMTAVRHPRPHGLDALGRSSHVLLPCDQSPAGLDACQFRFESPRIKLRPEFAAYALQSFTPQRPMREALLDLTARIHDDFRFDSKVTNVRTTTDEVFRKRRGRLPGFCALPNRLPSLHQPLGALCQRIPSHSPASRAAAAWWAPMHPTPGCPLIVRESAGSISIRPTTWSPRTATLRSPGAGLWRCQSSLWRDSRRRSARSQRICRYG